MTDHKLRLLIAEKEYLIAMDARDIVLSLMPCEVTVATMAELDQRLTEGRWDLVMIDVAGSADDNQLNAGKILSTGAGLVFLTGHTDLARGVPRLAEWPVVLKPFTEAVLGDAISRALQQAGIAHRATGAQT